VSWPSSGCSRHEPAACGRASSVTGGDMSTHGVERVERVERVDDERLTDYVGLTDVALRSRREPELGLYLAESDKVIRRALDAGHRPRSLLLSDRWLTPLAPLVERVEALGAPVFTGTPELLESITGFNVHRGAIASMHRPPPRISPSGSRCAAAWTRSTSRLPLRWRSGRCAGRSDALLRPDHPESHAPLSRDYLL